MTRINNRNNTKNQLNAMDQKRERWLTLRMTNAEYEELERLCRQTTCRSISEYSRKALLGQPVIKCFRSLSLDDFTNSMTKLKNDLNAIGSNFNQSVRRLHTLRHIPDIEQWILVNEQDKTRLFRQIETISNAIIQANKIWSRE
jgi:hypothetical protein